MKLATFQRDGLTSFGLVTDNGIVDIPSAMPAGPDSLLAALQTGPEAMARIAALADSAEPRLAIDSVRLLAPIANPPKLIGLAVNYVAHHNELQRGADMPDDPRTRTTPRPFIMPNTALAGPDDVITWPVFSEKIDHEVELVIVIGQTVSQVSPEDAPTAIAGYTIANDVSARSVSHAAGRGERPKDAFFDWLHGKWADGFLPMGPWLVTADEVPDPHALTIELAVNGDVRQQGDTGMMIHTVGQIVSFLSHVMTLQPGDVIATGTPAGVGAATGKFLQAGDNISCRITGLGELTNTLGDRPADFYRMCP